MRNSLGENLRVLKLKVSLGGGNQRSHLGTITSAKVGKEQYIYEFPIHHVLADLNRPFSEQALEALGKSIYIHIICVICLMTFPSLPLSYLHAFLPFSPFSETVSERVGRKSWLGGAVGGGAHPQPQAGDGVVHILPPPHSQQAGR